MLMMMLNAIRNQRGQGMVEYALIIALVGVVLAGALTFLQTGIDGTLRDAAGKL